MTEPELDVVMTAYNAAKHLPDALRSLQSQTAGDYRLIIVDDGSTDDTPRILAEAAARDPRITVISQPNLGIVAAANRGLAACSAAYVARHDADDLSDPGRFRDQLQFLRAHPECIAVAAAARHIDEQGRALGTRTRLRDPRVARADFVPAREPYLLHPFLMLRREALESVGGYRPLHSSEDSDLFWRLRQAGTLHNMPEVLGSYRLHPDSISNKSVENGRRLAFCSQVAALSAQRRDRQAPDLLLAPSLVQQVDRAHSLGELMALIEPQLAPGERGWLRLALAMKLIELCFYRSYEPSGADIRFLRDAWHDHAGRLTPDNLAIATESLTGTAVRLLLKGRIRDGLLIAGVRRAPVVILRLVFRIGLPERWRDRIKARSGRASRPA